jgi:tape measure domain-containing protein
MPVVGSVEFDVGFSRASVTSAISNLQSRFARLDDINIGINIDTNSVASDLNRFNDAVKEIASNGERAVQAVEKVEKSVDGLGSEASESTRSLNRIENSIDKVGTAARQANDPIGRLDTVLGGLAGGAAFALVDRLASAIGDLTRATIGFISESSRLNLELRSTENALTQIQESSEAAGESIDFLRGLADRTGQSFEALPRAYQSLAAAGAEVGISTNIINATFEETARVSGILGLTTERTGLAFQALSQIASKGVVSMEELRQQLGEQLPVAFGATARGLGITVELNELVASGEFTAREFFPAFVAGLRTIGGEVDPAVAALAVLGNQVGDSQRSLGAAIEPIQTGFSQVAAEILKTADTEKALEPLAAASQRLFETLSSNPEIAERLGRAFENSLAAGAEAAADLLDRLSESLLKPENIEAFADAIQGLGEGFENFVNQTSQATEDLTNFINVLEGLGLARSLEDIEREGVGAFGSLQNSINDLDGERVTVGFSGEFDEPLSQLLGIAQVDPIEVDVDTSSAQEGFTNLSGSIAGFAEQSTGLGAIESGLAGIGTVSAEATQSAKQLAKAQKEAFDEMRSASQEAVAGLQLASAEQLRAVNEQQLTGIDPEQLAIDRIDAERNATVELIAELEQQKAAVIAAAADGTIAAEAASAERLSIEKQLSSALDAELQTRIDKQAAVIEQQVSGIRSQFAELTSQLSLQQATVELDQQGFSDQIESLQLQQRLQDSIAQGAQSELAARVQAATEGRRFVEAAQIQAQLDSSRLQAIQRAQALEAQILPIQQAQRRSEREGIVLQAELNKLKAQEALLVAQAEGANANQISILQRAVTITERQESAARDRLASLERIEAIEDAISNQDNSNAQADAIREAEAAQQDLAEAQRKAFEERDQALEDLAEKEEALTRAQIDGAEKIAQARESALSGLFDAIAQESNTSIEDSVAAIDAAQERLKVAQRAGFFRGEEGSGAAGETQQALRDVERLISRNASDQQLANAAFRATQEEDGGQAFLEALQLAGRGDIASLAGAEDGFDNVSSVIAEVGESIQLAVQDVALAVRETNSLAIPESQEAQGFTGGASLAEKLDLLIEATQDRPIQAGGNTYQIYGEVDPAAAAQRIALDQVKSLTGGL